MRNSYKILIADDRDEDTSLLIGSFLDTGITVEATNARDADTLLEILKKDCSHFDLAIIDFYLSSKTAADVLSILNAEGIVLACPILILTSHISASQRQTLLAAGVRDILEKPGDLAGYSALIARILGVLRENGAAA